MSELPKRVLFALVGAPLTIALIYFGGWILATALGIVAALGAWELFRMAREAGHEPLDNAGIVLAATIPLMVHATYLGVFRITVTVGVLFFLALTAGVIWARGTQRKPLVSLALTVTGVIYPALVTYMYPIRYHDYAVTGLAGTVLVMLPIALTWATDTGAYFFGRTFGRHKLIPSVSPGKTVEGAIGGVVVAVIAGWLYVTFLLRPVAQLSMLPIGLTVFAILVSVIAQIGDLAESLFKRDSGVKDSSTLLPGHGGILDRFDSLLFVLPAAYVLLGLFLKPSP
ncbi:MAG TPA: phosphatidate cytidylyltransferase [Gemmatimonadaceae bacterium]